MAEKIKRIEKHMLSEDLQSALNNIAEVSSLKTVLENQIAASSQNIELSLLEAKINTVKNDLKSYFNKNKDKVTIDLLPDSLISAINSVENINKKADKSFVQTNYVTKIEQDEINGQLNDSLQSLQSRMSQVDTTINGLANDLNTTVAIKVNDVLPTVMGQYAKSNALNSYMLLANFTKTEGQKTVIDESSFSNSTKATLNALSGFDVNNYYTKTNTDKLFRSKADKIQIDDLEATLKSNVTTINNMAEDVTNEMRRQICLLYNGSNYGTTWYKNGDSDLTIGTDLDNKYGILSSWYSYPPLNGATASTDAGEKTLFDGLGGTDAELGKRMHRDIKTLYIYPYRFAHLASEWADTLGNLSSGQASGDNSAYNGEVYVTKQNNEKSYLVTPAKMTYTLLLNYIYSLLSDIAVNKKTVKAYVDEQSKSANDYAKSTTYIKYVRDNLFTTENTKLSTSEINTAFKSKIDVINDTTTTLSALIKRISDLEEKVAKLEGYHPVTETTDPTDGNTSQTGAKS